MREASLQQFRPDGERAGCRGTLPVMAFPSVCPSCGQPWTEQPEMIGQRRRDWASLAFRCLDCGIAYSNATNAAQRVRIVRDADRTVPPEVREGLAEALAAALNVRNRPSKRNTFCSANSEDAVTWTVFRGLALAERLAAVAQALAPDHTDNRDVDLLLWGVPVAGGDGKAIRDQLVVVSDGLGESKMSRSEPDIILVTETHVVFIEAKTGSGNFIDAGSGGWRLYLQDEDLFHVEPQEVQRAGYYELVRNWVIGNKLADQLDRDFLLVNLGPQPLEIDVEILSPLLGITVARNFAHWRWGRVLEAAEPLPEWLDRYAKDLSLRRI